MHLQMLNLSVDSSKRTEKVAQQTSSQASQNGLHRPTKCWFAPIFIYICSLMSNATARIDPSPRGSNVLIIAGVTD